MEKQPFQVKSEKIRSEFLRLKREHPERFTGKLTLSYSTWMFGTEDLEVSFRRLKNAGLEYVELPGNHHTRDLGLDIKRTKALLDKYDLKVSGICGLFSPETDLASDSPYRRQKAIDYLRREIDFAVEVGAEYIIVVPSAVGRPDKLDAAEYERSVEAVRIVAEDFAKAGVKAAIEPIRSAEVSLVHTVAEAEEFIKRVNHPGVQHLNGDIYHMLNEEEHIGEAILLAGDRLINLHLADSNRGPIGKGMIDVDEVIMALYLIGHNRPGRYVTGEALGIGGNPYALMSTASNEERFTQIVRQTVEYFRWREALVTEVV